MLTGVWKAPPTEDERKILLAREELRGYILETEKAQTALGVRLKMIELRERHVRVREIGLYVLGCAEIAGFVLWMVYR